MTDLQPDVVLMDLVMAPVDGIEATRTQAALYALREGYVPLYEQEND